MNNEMRSGSGQACARGHAGRGQQNLEVPAVVLVSSQQFDALVGMERLPTDSSGSTTPSPPSVGAAMFRSTVPFKATPPNPERHRRKPKRGCNRENRYARQNSRGGCVAARQRHDPSTGQCGPIQSHRSSGIDDTTERARRVQRDV
jgi:hypothetical protein